MIKKNIYNFQHIPILYVMNEAVWPADQQPVIQEKNQQPTC